MSSWNWSLAPMGWMQGIAFCMAMIIFIEGPIFYSDLVRGIAVGMFVMLLWWGLAGRRALLASICALWAAQAANMTPYEPEQGQGSTGHVIATHAIVTMIALIFVCGAWLRYRQARSMAQVSQG